MIGLKAKLIAGGVIAALVLAAGYKIKGWRNDAAKLDTLQAQIEQFRTDLADAEALAKVDAEADANTSGLLEDIRRERDLALEELDARPTLTRTVTKVLRDDCPVCNCPALGPDFRSVFNRAADTAASAAATAAASGGDAAVP